MTQILFQSNKIDGNLGCWFAQGSYIYEKKRKIKVKDPQRKIK